MERFLKPSLLDTDPSSPTAAKEWLHWKRTFQNFLTIAMPSTGTSASSESDTQTVSKLHMLTNFVSHTVFDYISECEDYDTAMGILEKLFIKPKNEVFARYLLATRKQKPGETLDQFLQELRMLAKDCNFVSVTAEKYKDESIRDAFINGLSSSNIRTRLLENQTLELTVAFDKARALEAAHKNAESYRESDIPTAAAIPSQMEDVTLSGQATSLAATSKPLTTPRVKQNSDKPFSNSQCFFCGNKRHPRSLCPAKDVSCLRCGSLGHFAKVCRNSKRQQQNSEQENFTQSASLYLASLTTSKKPFRVSSDAIVNELEHVNALIDSGSSEKSFISEAIVKRLKLPIHSETSNVGMAAGDIRLPVIGYCLVNIELQNRRYENVRVSVLRDLCTDLILGTDFQSRHSKLVIEYGGPEPPLTFCALTAMNTEPPRLFEHLTANYKPIRTKYRRHSVKDRIFMESEIKRMLSEGIIEPSHSPWRAQALVSRDGEKPRMVIDYSQTVNKFTPPDAYPLPRIDDTVNEIAKFKVMSTFDLRSAYHQVPLNSEDKKFTAFQSGGKLYQFCRMPFGVSSGVPCFQRIMDNFIDKHKLEGIVAYLDNVTVGGNNQEEHDRNVAQFQEAADKDCLTFNEKCVHSVTTLSTLGYLISNGVLKPDPDRLKPLLDLPVPHSIKSLRRVVGLFAYYAKWIFNFSEKIRPLNNSN